MKLTKLEEKVIQKLSDGPAQWTSLNTQECAAVTRLGKKYLAFWDRARMTGTRAFITHAGRAYLATLDQKAKEGAK